MRYYKIIQDGEVVGAGCNFLRWLTRSGKFGYCEMEQAECVKDVVGEGLYRDDWLRKVPDGVKTAVLDATVTLVDESEYNDIIEQLIDGETIPVPEPEPEPTPEPTPEPEPEPEHRMTVQEMRERIAELSALVMTGNEPFIADRTYTAGSIIVRGSRVYIADDVIVEGETVVPGRNCTETTIMDVINSLNSEENKEGSDPR